VKSEIKESNYGLKLLEGVSLDVKAVSFARISIGVPISLIAIQGTIFVSSSVGTLRLIALMTSILTHNFGRCASFS